MSRVILVHKSERLNSEDIDLNAVSFALCNHSFELFYPLFYRSLVVVKVVRLNERAKAGVDPKSVRARMSKAVKIFVGIVFNIVKKLVAELRCSVCGREEASGNSRFDISAAYGLALCQHRGFVFGKFSLKVNDSAANTLCISGGNCASVFRNGYFIAFKAQYLSHNKRDGICISANLAYGEKNFKIRIGGIKQALFVREFILYISAKRKHLISFGQAVFIEAYRSGFVNGLFQVLDKLDRRLILIEGIKTRCADYCSSVSCFLRKSQRVGINYFRLVFVAHNVYPFGRILMGDDLSLLYFTTIKIKCIYKIVNIWYKNVKLSYERQKKRLAENNTAQPAAFNCY